MFKIQLRVVRLLGRLGGLNSNLLPSHDMLASAAAVGTTTDNSDLVGSTGGGSGGGVGESLVAWDSTERIKFAVPFQDLKPEIFLGMFV